MLVRDGDRGLEVFMLRRTAAAVFAAGMYVFPGGKVDAADAEATIAAHCAGLDDALASRVLRLPSGGLRFWVAAIRECFEEAGVLLAEPVGGGGPLSFHETEVAERFNRYRREVHRGSLSLAALCEREGLRLTADSIGYVSRWITPMGQARRFDARFFVARAPQRQEPLHDDHETVESLWVRPADALERYRAGDLGMFTPTVSNLEFLDSHTSADAAVAAAGIDGVGADAVTMLPKVRVDVEGQVVALLLPGDGGYDDAPDYEVVNDISYD
jgi:8-oxo-dGTP pyrophosphatase MutT (NUDIX family)